MWLEQFLPWAPLAGVILAAVIGGIVTLVVKFGGDGKARKVPVPPTWPEMWARMDALEREQEELRNRMTERDAAFIQILHAVQQQWPLGYPVPVLPEDALEVLSDTIPKHWLPKSKFA